MFLRRIVPFCSQETKNPILPEKKKKTPIDSTLQAVYSCTQCNYRTTTTVNLRQHARRRNHQQLSHACDLCAQLFKTKQDLQAHITTLHPFSMVEYSCFQCNYKTKIQRNLNRHLRRHLPKSERQDKPKHHCSLCPKQFSSKYRLVIHRRNKHDKVFKYRCDICQKGFNVNFQFQMHLASHSNVTYIDCNLCKAKFRYRLGLFRHLQEVHQQPNVTE